MRHKQAITNVILILLTVGVIAVVWWFLVPAVQAAQVSLANKQALRDDYAGEVTKLQTAKQLLSDAGLSTGIPVTEEVLTAALPPQRDYEDLLAMIENMAGNSGITGAVSISLNENTTDTAKKSASATSNSASSAVNKTPLVITTEGSYDSLKTFLDNLQSGLRPIVINTIDLQPIQGGAVQISIGADTFTRNEPTKTNTTTSSNNQ